MNKIKETTVALNAAANVIEPHQIRRIAVLRALQLGDLLVAVPAIRALSQRFPLASITLIGLPWARDFAERMPFIDDFIEFPGAEGLPERTPQPDALPQFYRDVRARHFDIAVQMHGSGSIVNPIIEQFGAAHTMGYRPAADTAPAHFLQWNEHEPEVLRHLRLAEALGATTRNTALEFPIHADERRELAALLNRYLPLAPRPYVCVHPGARMPSRRWPAERFAAVADVLAEHGYTVVLTGSENESFIGMSVRRAMRHPAVNLIGKTSLGALAALVGDAKLVLSNDTGMSHIAAAMHTPSVIVSSGADAARWAPLDHQRHRVLWKATDCRPCSHAECPTEHECALDVTVDEVIDATADLLEWQHSRAA